MRSRHGQAEKLHRLNALAASLGEQVAFALELLASERGLQVSQAALQVLEENPVPAARPVVLERYVYCDASGNKRDPGGYLRSAILRVLRQIPRRDDIALLERAAWTYEFMPGADEVCWSIRANALIGLSDLDPELASYHSVRLLYDANTSKMSGEPAVTAARILAVQGRVLPLYAFAIDPTPRSSEARSEALRSLTHLPDSLLPSLVEKHRDSDDGIVLVGLFDLLLEHPAGAAFTDFIRDFLRATRLHDVHRYLVTTIVARRHQALLPSLRELARTESDPRKLENLTEALSLSPE